MTPKLTKAVKAAAQLPAPHQDALAEALMAATLRASVEDSLAAGEASFAADGGLPPDAAFARLFAKYDA